jgi:release factor glutamine methyltransferase
MVIMCLSRKCSAKSVKTLSVDLSDSSSELLESSIQFLTGYIPDPEFSAKYLLADVLKTNPAELFLLRNKKVKKYAEVKILKFLKRRKSAEPLQYITGKAYFRNLQLCVGPSVLIPRPETELIVELALTKIKRNDTVCDVGSGSGAIALSIAGERPDTTVFSSEISKNAVKYAKKNKKKINLKNITVCHGNLFSPFAGKKFNVIVANLPYIKSADIASLPCEIRNYEPLSALDGGVDGLDVIRKFFSDAPNFAQKGAFIIAEISPEQKKFLKTFIEKIPHYCNISFSKDLCGRTRFVLAQII